MEWIIQYENADGEISERRLSQIEYRPPNRLEAHCFLRQASRIFILSRIRSAVDANTGEVIADVKIALEDALRTTTARPLDPSDPEEARALRKRDKWHLFKPFQVSVLKAHAKSQLLASFDNRCAKCSRMSRLELDHYRPQIAGGRLVAGNINVLCSKCNIEKSDLLPEAFFDESQISYITDRLDRQIAMLAFKFDWDAWWKDQRGYLTRLGLSDEMISQAMDQPNHRYYCRHDGSPSGLSITLTVEGIDLIRKT